MRSKMFTLAITLTITGCNMSLFDTPIESAVRKELKDPGSAIFKDELRVDSRACLWVNAKNSFGGYVGGKYAHLVNLGKNHWYVETLDGEACVTSVLKEKIALDILNKEGERILLETLKKHKLIDDSSENIWSIKDHNCRNFASKLRAWVRLSNSSKDPEAKKHFENQVREALLAAVATSECPVLE